MLYSITILRYLYFTQILVLLIRYMSKGNVVIVFYLMAVFYNSDFTFNIYFSKQL